MAYENIEIEHGNFTIGPTGATILTMNHEDNTLIEKTLTGTVVFTYAIEINIFEVQSLQYDGYYYWTLERQGTAGFRVRKWEIDSGNVVRLVDDFSFISDVINRYDVNSMAVEFYEDSLDNQIGTGTTTFDLNDGEVVRIGDRIVIGPSTAAGFEGLYFETDVINKTGDKTITVSPALNKTFSPDDPVHFTRSFFVFSDTGPGGLPGALYKYRWDDGFILSVYNSNMFTGVRASTFFQNQLMFVKAGEVIWLDPESQIIEKVQSIDNATADRADYHTTYDLAGFSNELYRLEQSKTYYSGSQWLTENWAPNYNYNTSSVVPEVFFVAVKADPPMVHRFKSGIPTAEIQSLITVTVLDQFRTPVFNRIVDLSSTGGPLSSIQETTDTNGQVRVTYTADSTLGNVTITADVP